jgi:hypothetical protein
VKGKNRGFLTLENLFSLALYALIGLSIATFAAIAFKQTHTVTIVNDYTQMVNEVKSVAASGLLCTYYFGYNPTGTANPNACFANGLGCVPPNSGNLSFTMPNGNVVAAGQTYRTFDINTVQYKSVTVIANPTPTGTVAAGFIYIMSQLNNDLVNGSGQQSNEGTTGIPFKEEYIPIYAHVDAQGKILDCLGANGDGPQEVCQNLGGTFNNANQSCDVVSNFNTGPEYQANANRGQTVTTPTTASYSFCALTTRINGGDTAGEGCTIAQTGGTNGSYSWSLTATNINSPGVWCSMRCICAVPSPCPTSVPQNSTPYPPVTPFPYSPTPYFVSPSPSPTATPSPTPTPTPGSTPPVCSQSLCGWGMGGSCGLPGPAQCSSICAPSCPPPVEGSGDSPGCAGSGDPYFCTCQQPGQACGPNLITGAAANGPCCSGNCNSGICSGGTTPTPTPTPHAPMYSVQCVSAGLRCHTAGDPTWFSCSSTCNSILTCTAYCASVDPGGGYCSFGPDDESGTCTGGGAKCTGQSCAVGTDCCSGTCSGGFCL